MNVFQNTYSAPDLLRALKLELRADRNSLWGNFLTEELVGVNPGTVVTLVETQHFGDTCQLSKISHGHVLIPIQCRSQTTSYIGPSKHSKHHIKYFSIWKMHWIISRARPH